MFVFDESSYSLYRDMIQYRTMGEVESILGFNVFPNTQSSRIPFPKVVKLEKSREFPNFGKNELSIKITPFIFVIANLTVYV